MTRVARAPGHACSHGGQITWLNEDILQTAGFNALSESYDGLIKQDFFNSSLPCHSEVVAEIAYIQSITRLIARFSQIGACDLFVS